MKTKTVTVTHGVDQDHSHRLQYDHLVLALGAVTNFFGTPGVAERAFTMKTLGDAIAIRNRVIEYLLGPGRKPPSNPRPVCETPAARTQSSSVTVAVA